MFSSTFLAGHRTVWGKLLLILAWLLESSYFTSYVCFLRLGGLSDWRIVYFVWSLVFGCIRNSYQLCLVHIWQSLFFGISYCDPHDLFTFFFLVLVLHRCEWLSTKVLWAKIDLGPSNKTPMLPLHVFSITDRLSKSNRTSFQYTYQFTWIYDSTIGMLGSDSSTVPSTLHEPLSGTVELSSDTHFLM